jgi:all-trans-retinol dehydrogenase (NAD+)
MMKTYYQHKTILITGAASGIGKRFAEKVSQASQARLILWDRNPEFLTEIRQQLQPAVEVHCAGVDVTDPDAIQFEADHCIKEGLVPDIIINCAGIVIGKMFHEHTFDEIERTLQINTTGSMWVVRAFLNEMIERGSGHIVNLASASGYIGNPRMSVYAASKWGVIGWSESLRLEMERMNTGIYVTAVIPSYIKTGMFDGVSAPRLVPLLETDQIVEKMLHGITKQKRTIQAPFMVRFVPLLKAILPYKAFDWVAGNLLGVYKSMDSFKGRDPKSS